MLTIHFGDTDGVFTTPRSISITRIPVNGLMTLLPRR